MSDESKNRLRENLAAIQQRVAAACARSHRQPHDITVVAVTKYAELSWVEELILLGVRELGEARPQQLAKRAEVLDSAVRWHLIGHLQRNKVEDILPLTDLIHSVDSTRLFEQIARQAEKLGRRPRILLEVNIANEESKDGFTAEELIAAWPALQTTDSVEIAGLMAMAPLSDDAEASRPYFRQLRELRDRLKADCNGRWSLDQLSMGMSGDFEVGIEEGATIVRIGSSFFEGLEVPQP
ncbi:YggS family pyridoxal phosphate-dependent enzyme [Schlesneria sp. T3-172]|uniref:YggS family pyridoxal phosphate-dependent enzyme n=1 Tax=Schlesneria sphaerica TaxID=3373610 RepID=UPI0037C9F17F